MIMNFTCSCSYDSNCKFTILSGFLCAIDVDQLVTACIFSEYITLSDRHSAYTFFFFLIGVCTVRILNNEQYVEPAYVYYALGTFKKGIPCRSTMFNVYGDRFTDRPDEIAIQQCNMSCKLNS